MSATKPIYLVTADVRYLIEKWCKEHGYLCPSPQFFCDCHVDLMRALNGVVGDRFELRSLDAGILRDGLRGNLQFYDKDMSVVVIDRVMGEAVPSHRRYIYEATRVTQFVRGNNHEPDKWVKIGEAHRPGCETLEVQAARLGHQLNGGSVLVVDDGCFEGKSLDDCAKRLASKGLKVHTAVVGIMRGLEDGKTPEVNFDFHVHPFIFYEHKHLSEWVCERDFMMGIPDGGRVVLVEDVFKDLQERDGLELCAPYLEGFGDPCGWASVIGRGATEFTKAALEISRRLFEEIGRISGRPVPVADVKRWPYYHGRPLTRFVRQPFIELIDDLIREV